MQRATVETARPTIEPRDVRFSLGTDRRRHWHSADPVITHFFNGLSLMFPAGERFFMASVRSFLNRIDEPDLREQILRFLAQEGIHSREHDRYNRTLETQGYWVANWLERATGVALDLTRRFTSQKWQLAITCAFEHFTAILAEVLLRDPQIMRDADPEYARLWRWHAVEETEHKAVAFDLYRTVAPGLTGYVRRAAVMWIVSLNYMPYVLFHQLLLVAHDDPQWPFKAHLRALRFFWWKPGFFLQTLLPYLRYYHPSFHPWQDDTSDLVWRWRAEQGDAPRP
jgi:predicted metal-dependent hydrolase